MKLQHTNNYNVPSPYKVSGTTRTIPALAPSLIELLESNLRGEPLPLSSRPHFDDNEQSGMVRIEANRMNFAEIQESRSEFEGLFSSEVTKNVVNKERTATGQPENSQSAGASGVVE